MKAQSEIKEGRVGWLLFVWVSGRIVEGIKLGWASKSAKRRKALKQD